MTSVRYNFGSLIELGTPGNSYMRINLDILNHSDWFLIVKIEITWLIKSSIRAMLGLYFVYDIPVPSQYLSSRSATTARWSLI